MKFQANGTTGWERGVRRALSVVVATSDVDDSLPAENLKHCGDRNLRGISVAGRDPALLKLSDTDTDTDICEIPRDFTRTHG